MKKIYFVGDCHMSRVLEHHDDNIKNIKFWGLRGLKCWELNLQQMEDENVIASGKEFWERDGDNKKYQISFAKIKEFNPDIVVLWIGYVDIRQLLPKHKDADLVAKKYIEEIQSYFKNSKIMLIEPLPQNTDMLLKYEGISAWYSYKDRKQQNDEFNESLQKYAKKAEIPIIASQKDILDALGVKELTPDMTNKLVPHPSDGLNADNMQIIYDLFMEKISHYND
jgi:hypothetical protein